MGALKNQKHEAFARELAKGKPQGRAYKDAGYSPNDGAASRLAKNVKVQERVAELQERAAIRTEVTVQQLTEMLMTDREMARELGQPSAAVNAVNSIAKLNGLIVDKSEQKHTISHEDALKELE